MRRFIVLAICCSVALLCRRSTYSLRSLRIDSPAVSRCLRASKWMVSSSCEFKSVRSHAWMNLGWKIDALCPHSFCGDDFVGLAVCALLLLHELLQLLFLACRLPFGHGDGTLQGTAAAHSPYTLRNRTATSNATIVMRVLT